METNVNEEVVGMPVDEQKQEEEETIGLGSEEAEQKAEEPTGMSVEELVKEVTDRINAITDGPLAMKLYMDTCVRCGTCATVCPVYYGGPEKFRNPVVRSDLIRSVYKKYNTTSGKLLGSLVGAEGFDGDMEEFVRAFYECTGCRRCATYCPMGIDNSVLTRKGRGIADALGFTPETMARVVKVSLETCNTDGASPKAFMGAIEFLEEEMEDEHGIEIKIPVDVKGVDYFYVPPSGDVLVNPEATTGIAKVFYVLGMQDNWTMSSRCFDGANYGLFTGSDADMKADNKPYVDEAIDLGVKYMFMGECGHAYRIMKMMMEKAQWWGELPFKVINCMEWTADRIMEGKLEFDKSKNPMPVTYHDPCNFGRSCGIVEAPRVILEASCMDFREMHPNRSDNWCCGGGGGLSAMDDIQEFRMNVSGKKKIEQVRATGAKYLATACSNCKRQFMQLVEYHNEDYAVGGVHDMLSRAIKINGKAAERTSYE